MSTSRRGGASALGFTVRLSVADGHTMDAMDVGAPELLIILVVALLIFGPSQLPKLSRSLGQAAREFRHGSEPGSAGARESGAGGSTSVKPKDQQPEA